MTSKKGKLSAEDIENVLYDTSGESEPYEDSGSEYLESDDDESSSEGEECLDMECGDLGEEESSGDEEIGADCVEEDCAITVTHTTENIWTVNSNLHPPKEMPPTYIPSVLCNINRGSSELEIFLKLFPRSLLIWISQCTNERISIVKKAQGAYQKPTRSIPETDQHEILAMMGIMLVTSYNRLPKMPMYWSKRKSVGNALIRDSMSRDRFLLLHSKFYCNSPEKPNGCSKSYYIEEVVSCLKQTYAACREDSSFQALDESMVKFKGRSTLKQYLPMKPIKRGIKIWERSDSASGYVYDFNIYCGKNDSEKEVDNSTLGERVVLALTTSIKRTNVALFFDRFFSSVYLFNSLPFPAVGTIISNRKQLPSCTEKLKRGESVCYQNQFGTSCVFWQDTKRVTVMSNCHGGEMGLIQRKQKSGEKITLNCPKSIVDYNQHMGGVDLSDQMSQLYDINRKSTKWWKKVFYKLLQTTCVNSWILYKETHHLPNLPYIDFIAALAEDMIKTGLEKTKVPKKKKSGRHLKNRDVNYGVVGDHMPIEGPTRRRCVKCSKDKKGGKNDKRTFFTCKTCEVPLCFKCFSPYHM